MGESAGSKYLERTKPIAAGVAKREQAEAPVPLLDERSQLGGAT